MIVGANILSLETVSTIKKEYPNIKEIFVVEENETMWLEDKFGE